MNKNLSIISMFAMILFMTATYVTAQSQSSIADVDTFGFPFTFFSATNNGEAIIETHFSLLALVGNLALSFAIATGIVTVLSLFKVEKKKAIMA